MGAIWNQARGALPYAAGDERTKSGTTLEVRMAAVVRVGPHRAGHGIKKGTGDVKRPYDGELLFSAELTSTEL